MTGAVQVKFLGDAASLDRETSRARQILQRFGGDVDRAARQQVAAGVQQRESLQKLAVEYKEVAASAVKGSDEQIVALAKAEQAQRAYAATAKTTAVESDSAFSKASSGAAGLVKQAALFGAGFLGLAGLRDSIHAVLDAEESTSKLDKALVNAHASVSALEPVLAKYADTSRRLGFADDETRQAETELVTAFGATKHALDELSVAQDLARSRNEDLGTAAQQLILLQEGSTHAAKQFGLTLPDLTAQTWRQKAAEDALTVSQEKGKLLYDELLPRIKNQSEAFANSPSGKIAEFHAEITKLEESIGAGLLPAVDDYLTKIDDWLSKGKNQQKVTHDVGVAAHDLASVLHDLTGLTRDFLHLANPVAHALGGWKTVIEALIALKFAFVIQGWSSSIKKLIGVEAAAGAGEGLLGAEGAAGGLRTALLALGGGEVLAALGAVAAAVAGILVGLKLSSGSRYTTIHTPQGNVTVTPNGLRGGLVTRDGQQVGVGSKGPVPTDDGHTNHDDSPRGSKARQNKILHSGNIVKIAKLYGPASGCKPLPFPPPRQPSPQPVKIIAPRPTKVALR